MGLPLPPNAKPVKAESNSESKALGNDESEYILNDRLIKKHREDPSVLAFIDAFIRSKSIQQASSEAGISPKLGYMYRHRKDISECIQALIDRSAIKYGFDASEVVERVKEIVDFDPIMLQNADGTFKDNLFDIPPEARRALKKMKVKNLYSTDEDMNGIGKKFIIGKVIEYEFYDKIKSAELVGREKDVFKNKTVVEHSVTKDMASVLLASSRRGEEEIKMIKSRVVDAEVRVVDTKDESDET